VTNTRIARTAPPGTPPDPADHERLLDACREALAWFDRQARHAPAEFEIGGEGRIRRRLREAVRLASYELRPCSACDDGTTYNPTVRPTERPRLVPCATCDGAGQVRVFLYPKPKRRGR
jgi:hypothetical protein